jgi:hypothetical protein
MDGFKKIQYLVMLDIVPGAHSSKDLVLNEFTQSPFTFALPSDPTEPFRLVASLHPTIPDCLLIQSFLRADMVAFGARSWVKKVCAKTGASITHLINKVLV